MWTGNGCRDHRHELAVLGFDGGPRRGRRDPVLHHDVHRRKTRPETTREGTNKGNGKQRSSRTRLHSHRRRSLIFENEEKKSFSFSFSFSPGLPVKGPWRQFPNKVQMFLTQRLFVTEHDENVVYNVLRNICFHL